MKRIIPVALLMVSSVSQADVIKCLFTEPFVASVYDMSNSTLTYSALAANTTVINNVNFKIKSAGVFELVSIEGNVLQTLKLNFKGSDGMSDKVFPFDVKDSQAVTNRGYGGCTSDSLKVAE